MFIPSARRVGRLILACLLPVFATTLQWQLREHLPPHPWLLLYPAVFFSAQIGGLLGGLIALLTAIPLAIYFFVPPALEWQLADTRYLYSIIVFAGMGLSFSLLHGRMAKLQSQLQRQTESTLENAESQLRLVLNATQSGLWKWMARSGGLYASTATQQLHNLPAAPKIIRLRKWLCSVYPYDRPHVKAVLKSQLRAGHSFVLEYRVANHQSSDDRWLLVVAEPRRDASGALQYYEGLVLDISERKKTQLENQNKEAEFRQLAEAMPQIVWVSESNGNNIYFNQQWVDYTGLTLEESYGAGWNTPIHPDDQARVWQAWQQAVQEQTTYELECRLRRHDGNYRWWLVRGVPNRDHLGRIQKWFGTCTDIHDLKVKESELRDSEFRWQFALEGSHQGVWDWDIPSGKVFFSTRWKSMLGFSDEMLGDHVDEWASRVHPDDLRTVMQDVDSHLKGETDHYENVHRVKNREGDYLWILDRGMVVTRDGNGQAIRMIGTHTDITQQRLTLDALRDSEAMLNLFLNHNPIIAWVKDAEGRYVYINSTYEQRFGVSLQDWIGKTDFDTWPESVAREFQANDQAVLQSGEPSEVVEQTFEKSGKPVFWRNFKFPFQNQAGKWFVGGIGIDETSMINTQRMLIQKERLLADSQHIAHIGSWMLDIESKQITWSRETFRLYGLPPAAFPPTLPEIFSFIHPDDQTAVEEWFSHCCQGQTPRELEYRIHRQNGSQIWLLLHGAVESDKQGKMTRIIGTIQDITKRKNLQDQLIESLHRLELFVQHSPVAVALFDTSMRYLVCSRRWIQDYQLSEDHLIGQSHYELFPEIGEEWKWIHQRALNGEVISSEEDSFQRLDGSIQVIRWEVRPWYDNAGKVGGIAIFTEDITSRKAAQAQIVMLGTALEASANAIVITNPSGEIEWVNQGFTHMTGYSREDMIGKGLRELLTAPASQDAYDEMWATVLSGEVWSGELDNQHRNGTTFPVEQVMTPILDNQGQVAHVIAVKKDISKRKETELALQNSLINYQQLSHHLETIREDERIRIAREIHDELGGFLTALKIDLSLLLKKIPTDSVDCLAEVEAMKTDIHQGLKAIKRIINDLRPSVLDHLGLMAAIEWLGNSLLKPSGIGFIVTTNDDLTQLSPELSTAIFRIIQEALVNIVKHANAKQVQIQIELADQDLSFCIIDDGKGMKPENPIDAFGLKGMRERARHFGGDLVLETALQGGTVIRARVLLERVSMSKAAAK